MNRKTLTILGTAAAGLAVLVVALSARGRLGLSADGSSSPDSSPPPIPTLKKKARRGGAPKEVELSGTVDLLDFIDAKTDSVAGSWGFEDNSLVTSAVSWGRLQLPVAPPEEYDLQFQATRKGGANSLNIGLVVGERQVVLIMDGWDKGDKTGLDRVGEKSFFENETTYVGQIFLPGKPAKVLCKVRKASVAVQVNGAPVLGWKGDVKQLSLWPDWKVPEKRALFLGSWESVFRLDELVLTPVSGRAALLR
jgi:hypothetical protein